MVTFSLFKTGDIVAGQQHNHRSDAGTGRTSRAWVHGWKAHQVEENMALVLADMLWYREAWTRWMPTLVRSLPGLVGGPGGSPGELA